MNDVLKEVQDLGRRLASADLTKEASLADAILGAPLGALAARISAPADSKEQATKYGLLLGALMGFVAGQKALVDHKEGKDPGMSPAMLSILAGAAVGGKYHLSPPGKLLPKKDSD